MVKKFKIKKRSGFIIGVVAVAVLITGIAAFMNVRSGKAAQTEEVTAMKLAKTSIRDTMSLSGTINSANTENVYSTLTYPVKGIFVEVGDKVKAGDVLAILDVKELEFEIRQAENNYESALSSASEDERSLLQNRTDSSYSVQTAKLSLDKANASYSTQKQELEQGTSSKLVSEQKSIDNAMQTLENAKTTLQNKERDYEANKRLYDAGGVSKSELDTSEAAYKTAVTDLASAETSYNNAVKNYESVKNTLASELQTAARDVQSARLNYESAQSSLENAQSKTSTSAYSLENQLISLEKLRSNYEDAEIKAGIDGTVTAVNAIVGSSANGILFVVEDDADLYAEIFVKEYNLSKVAVGQTAIVTSDATGRDALSGEVSQIAPKAAEGSDGTTVEFETRVKINDYDERLKIGMNAFAAIITGRADDVFAVSSDMLVRGQGGQYSVYALENGVVAEVPVTLGLETATSTEISGNLTEGMLIITNPSAVTVGEKVEATVLETAGPMMRSGTAPNAGQSGDGTATGNRVRMDSGDSGEGPAGAMQSGPPPMN